MSAVPIALVSVYVFGWVSTFFYLHQIGIDQVEFLDSRHLLIGIYFLIFASAFILPISVYLKLRDFETDKGEAPRTDQKFNKLRNRWHNYVYITSLFVAYSFLFNLVFLDPIKSSSHFPVQDFPFVELIPFSAMFVLALAWLSWKQIVSKPRMVKEMLLLSSALILILLFGSWHIELLVWRFVVIVGVIILGIAGFSWNSVTIGTRSWSMAIVVVFLLTMLTFNFRSRILPLLKPSISPMSQRDVVMYFSDNGALARYDMDRGNVTSGIKAVRLEGSLLFEDTNHYYLRTAGPVEEESDSLKLNKSEVSVVEFSHKTQDT